MRMRQTIYVLLLAFFSCQQNPPETKKPVDTHAARALYDSAVSLTYVPDSENYAQAVLLLDQATGIDPDFYTAYRTKLVFQCQLEQYGEALKTAKELNRLKPDAPDFYALMGRLYDKTGDSISAYNQYKEALIRYNSILDTMDKSKDYDVLLMNKGITLILSGQEAKGNDILKQLYARQTDPEYREMLKMFLNQPRKKILEIYKPGN